MRKDWHMEEFTGTLSREKWRDMVTFAAHLRAADVREVEAYGDGDASRQVVLSQENSEGCWMVYDKDHRPIVFFGRVKPKDGRGRLIWCLATDGMKAYEREFAVVSKRILANWAESYDVLFNAVGRFNVAAMRWLRWCGAIFYDPFLVNGEEFIRFYIGHGEESRCAE
jgi:hypothetical protein|nr:MAG TPA: Protein of unknown function (DUF2833) [Caudoviricetes sp.]